MTGRRSGAVYTFPVAYVRDGDQVTITVGWPERKRWWRNLLDGAPVTLVLSGVERTGTARAIGDEQAGVTVEVQLDAGDGSSDVSRLATRDGDRSWRAVRCSRRS